MSSISWYLESIYIRVNYYGYQQHGTWQNLVKPVADIRRTKGTELDAWSFSFWFLCPLVGDEGKEKQERERERGRYTVRLSQECRLGRRFLNIERRATEPTTVI